MGMDLLLDYGVLTELYCMGCRLSVVLAVFSATNMGTHGELEGTWNVCRVFGVRSTAGYSAQTRYCHFSAAYFTGVYFVYLFRLG